MKKLGFLSLFLFLLPSFLFGADDQWGFILNSVLDVFQNAFSWLISLVIFVVAVVSIIGGANWLTAVIVAVSLITATFAAPNIIKKVRDYALKWNPQTGVWN